MRRLAVAVMCCGLMAAVPLVRAQESAAAAHGTSPGEEEHGKTLAWMWANFLLLAGGLGYLVYKNAGPYYASRSRKIRKDLIEADDLRKEAEQRAAEIERRLSNLEAEIIALRAESQREAEAETERLASQTTAELAKIQFHAEQEIDAAGRAARMELRRYSAALAVGLAAQKIRGRMSTQTQDALVGSFIQKLEQPTTVAQGI